MTGRSTDDQTIPSLSYMVIIEPCGVLCASRKRLNKYQAPSSEET